MLHNPKYVCGKISVLCWIRQTWPNQAQDGKACKGKQCLGCRWLKYTHSDVLRSPLAVNGSPQPSMVLLELSVAMPFPKLEKNSGVKAAKSLNWTAQMDNCELVDNRNCCVNSDPQVNKSQQSGCKETSQPRTQPLPTSLWGKTCTDSWWAVMQVMRSPRDQPEAAGRPKGVIVDERYQRN